MPGFGMTAATGVSALVLLALSFDGWADLGPSADRMAPAGDPVRSAGESPASDTPRRILLITCDTLRADRLGCYGYEKAQTPNIDGLARQGVMFKNHYVQAPATGPSHASILTGRYPWEHRVVANGSKFRPEEVSLSEVFQEQGYQTVAWIACGILLARQGYDQGFDKFHDDLEWTPAWPENHAEKQTEQAIAYFQSADRDANIFAWLHYYDPHSPYWPPMDFRKQFMDDPEREVDTSRDRLSSIYWERIQLAPFELEDLQALYDAEVAYMDAEIGRLLDALREAQLLEDTLIVLTSDHGEELYDHDCFIEHNLSLYEGVIRAPLIFWGKTVPTVQKTREALTESVDVFPTLLSLAGIAGPERYPASGIDLFDPARLRSAPRRERVIFAQLELTNLFEPAYAVRQGVWKLIRFHDGAAKLFHLTRDPREQVNLKNREPLLRRKLEKEIQQILDLIPESVQPLDPNTLPEDTLDTLKALGYVN